MTTPAGPSPSTQLWFRTLPSVLTDPDAALGYPLRRYLSLIGDLGNDVDVLADRFSADKPGALPGTGVSELTDPLLCDRAWLPWLAQLVGVRLSPALTEQAARDAVRFAPAGWRSGSKSAVAQAAQSALTGTKYAVVYDHTINTPGDGTVWDVLIVTRASETPDAAAALAAVVAKGAKPAGVVLRQRTYTASWSAVQTAYPTWTTRNGKTWQQLAEAGL